MLNRSLLNINFLDYNISKFSFMDVLDILIVACCIYKILIWIKETRAWALFKGVVIIIIISSLAFFLGLTTIWWIVKTTVNVGILALIIIFQPELRKALEQLGTGNFASFLNPQAETELEIYSKTIDEILKALNNLSNTGTGALIVIQRDVALGDIEQTGIKIDAIVSASLLINIFVDKTPLHDGAVIIKNNRISSATCILPLTKSEIGKELGTRHRAAVGITETSDAYVLVVSEETKSVSIAVDGKIYLNLTQEQIKQFIGGNRKNLKRKFGLRRGYNEGV